MKRKSKGLDWDVSAHTRQGVELSIRLTTVHSVDPGWKAWLGDERQASTYDSIVRSAVSEAVTAVVAGITVEGMIATRKDVEWEVLGTANERLVGQPCRLELISFMSFSDNQGYIGALGRRVAANRKEEPITDS
ncbi:MAG: hypothetical protein NVS1B3_05640 [Candidatus Dormibacteraceae bacterium]